MEIQTFERYLEDNIFKLHEELVSGNYHHSNYISFYIKDPKLRKIHKAEIKDRIVHHLLYKYLYSIFDSSFIFDLYSSRIGKGTHRAVERLEKLVKIVSRNNSRACFVLKADIRKFFDSINHKILLNLISKKIDDKEIVPLIDKVIDSFQTGEGKGLPLGNVTSQIFANIYLNELDKFIKHKLRVKYYLRYCDDFLILSDSRDYLARLIPKISSFLESCLILTLHPNKVFTRKHSQGIDFLGYVVLPYHRVLRIKTRKRIFSNIEEGVSGLQEGAIAEKTFHQSLQSYIGILKHANCYNVQKQINVLLKDI